MSSELQSLLNEASRHLGKGDNVSAQACLEKVLELDGKHFDALHILGVLAHRAGQTDRALDLIAQALAVNPDFPEAHFNHGKILHDAGRAAEAVAAYERALALRPEWDAALFNLGLLYARQKGWARAADCFEQAIRINAADAEYFFNLGNVRLEMGEREAAIRAFEESLARDPSKFKAHNNLGNLYKQSGDFKRAAASYEAALRLDPGYAGAWYNLGNLSEQQADPDRALEHYRKAVECDPSFAKAYNNMGNVYHQLKQYDRALEAYRQAVKTDPTLDSSRHMINSLTGSQPESAPAAYVASLFDRAAPDFEQRLVGDLKYRIFQELKAAVRKLAGEGHRFGRGVDLGCGTGLAGREFRPLAEVLEGVDLSSKMIELARKNSIYDACHCRDIVGFLKESAERFDLFIAADVLVYLGNLNALFAAVKKCARQGALWAFSTERSEEENFRLQPSGRFAHSRTYIADLAKKHGFSVEFQQNTVIRTENDRPIPGDNFILKAG